MVWTIVLTLVFIECAFIIGLFLPGDSLLFTAGVVLAQRNSAGNAWALAAAAVAVAVAGNMVGYYIGRRTGTSTGRPTGCAGAHHGTAGQSTGLPGSTWLVVGRAGQVDPVDPHAGPADRRRGRMNPRRFMLSTFVGAIAWVPALVIAGYYGAGLLGHFPWVRTTVTLSASCSSWSAPVTACCATARRSAAPTPSSASRTWSPVGQLVRPAVQYPVGVPGRSRYQLGIRLVRPAVPGPWPLPRSYRTAVPATSRPPARPPVAPGTTPRPAAAAPRAHGPSASSR